MPRAHSVSRVCGAFLTSQLGPLPGNPQPANAACCATSRNLLARSDARMQSQWEYEDEYDDSFDAYDGGNGADGMADAEGAALIQDKLLASFVHLFASLHHLLPLFAWELGFSDHSHYSHLLACAASSACMQHLLRHWRELQLQRNFPLIQELVDLRCAGDEDEARVGSGRYFGSQGRGGSGGNYGPPPPRGAFGSQGSGGAMPASQQQHPQPQQPQQGRGRGRGGQQQARSWVLDGRVYNYKCVPPQLSGIALDHVFKNTNPPGYVLWLVCHAAGKAAPVAAASEVASVILIGQATRLAQHRNAVSWPACAL